MTNINNLKLISIIICKLLNKKIKISKILLKRLINLKKYVKRRLKKPKLMKMKAKNFSYNFNNNKKNSMTKRRFSMRKLKNLNKKINF